MEALWTLFLSIIAALVSLLMLGAAFHLAGAVVKSVPAAYMALRRVRWPYCLLHAALGSLVSIWVSPKLPAPLVAAAGVTSTCFVAAMVHGIREFIRPAQLQTVPAKKALAK